MFAWLESPVKSYLNARYGEAANPSRQYQFYRCELCHSLVTWKDIANGGCRCGVGSRIRAAHLSVMEKCRLLLSPWG